MNSLGKVVGQALPAGGRPTRGFLWEDDANGGSVIDLGGLGGESALSSAEDINDQGQVVGGSRTSEGNSHAFLWQDGAMTDLGVLGEPDDRFGSPQTWAWYQQCQASCR